MSSLSLSGLPQSLVELVRGYALLCSTRLLHFPTNVPFARIHDFFLNQLLLHPHFIAYPPSVEYQKSFWKWVIQHLENIFTSADDEIDERLYEHSISLLRAVSAPQAVGARPPAPSYFTYIWSCDSDHHTATLMESRTTIESGTTGMKTWRASLVLSQYLIQNPELVRGKSILEFGSGVGLLGLIIASLQSGNDHDIGRIMLTDVSALVLQRCEDNLALPCNLSSRHPDIRTQELDWTDALYDSRRPILERVFQETSPDLIIGADVVFDPSIIPALVKTLELALVGDTLGLLALTVRNETTIAEFLRVAERSLDMADVAISVDESFWGVATLGDSDHDQQVRVFQLHRKQGK